MANLTVVAADVAPILTFEKVTLPAAEAIDAGEIVRLDTTSGKATLANASSAAEGRLIGIAINSAVAGQALTVVRRGLVDLGDAVTSETIDELILASDTDGKMDNGAGSPTVSIPIGRVWPSFGVTTADKVLFVDVNLGGDPAIANLAGDEVANIATSNTEGGLVVLFVFAIATGAAAAVDITLDNKIQVIDAWAVHTAAGEASDTLIVSSTASTIGTIDWAGSDGDIDRLADIDNANSTIVAGGILRITSVDDDAGTDVGAGTAYVLAHRIV